MRVSKFGLSKQDGVSLVGLIVTLAALGFVGVIGMQIVPSYSEYRAIMTAIKTAKEKGGTVREMQQSFDNSATVTYISSVRGSDLIIGKEDGEMQISFAYEKKIPLFGPASILLEYNGSTSKTGIAATAPTEK